MSTTAALALTAANERQIIEAFRGLRAVNLKAARQLRELGLNDSKALRGMVAATIIRRAGPQRYFLDESVWAGRRGVAGSTAVRVAVVLAVLAAALTAFYLLA